MAPPKKPWLRLYTEAPSDRKIRRLKPEHRWVWVCVLCAARESPIPGELWVAEGEPMTVKDLADFSGVSTRMVRAALASMEEVGLITTGVAVVVPRFMDRQFESDSSTKRVAKYRSQPVDNSGFRASSERTRARIRSELNTKTR